MKRNYTGKLWMLLVLLTVLFACGQKGPAGGHSHAESTQYTCPMHPQVVREGPGQCPICGMDLVPKTSGHGGSLDSSLLPLLGPSNARVAANMPTLAAESGLRIFSLPVQGVVSYDTRRQTSISSRVGGRVERVYIRYNYQPVRKGQLLLEIYSPDLAAAQRELIYISRNDNDPSLLQRAKLRLSLLGMTATQIERVIRTGSPMYRVPVYSPVSGYIVEQAPAYGAPDASAPMAGPATASSSTSGGGMSGMGGSGATTSVSAPPAPVTSPVLLREGQYVTAGQTVFNVYGASSLLADFYLDPTLAAYVRRGQRLTYHAVANPNTLFTGVIGLVEPTQRQGGFFTTARVYTGTSGLQPGQLLAGRLPVVARGWWLPETAVVGLGSRSVVFKKEGGVFLPKEVPTGIRVQGQVQVLDSVARWEIAKNASYLIGSESFIRTSQNN